MKQKCIYLFRLYYFTYLLPNYACLYWHPWSLPMTRFQAPWSIWARMLLPLLLGIICGRAAGLFFWGSVEPGKKNYQINHSSETRGGCILQSQTQTWINWSSDFRIQSFLQNVLAWQYWMDRLLNINWESQISNHYTYLSWFIYT